MTMMMMNENWIKTKPEQNTKNIYVELHSFSTERWTWNKQKSEEKIHIKHTIHIPNYTHTQTHLKNKCGNHWIRVLLYLTCDLELIEELNKNKTDLNQTLFRCFECEYIGIHSFGNNMSSAQNIKSVTHDFLMWNTFESLYTMLIDVAGAYASKASNWQCILDIWTNKTN